MSKIALSPNANGTGTFTLSAPNGNTSRTMVLPDADGTLLTTEQIPAAYPTGSVIYHAANAAPTGFIKANGATVSRTTYADLFASIGTLYGAGDGSSTFEVPDLRGEFMRGFDDGRGVDASRVFGSAQADELKAHTHSLVGGAATGTGAAWNAANQGQTLTTASTGGVETRPRNVALLACIKF